MNAPAVIKKKKRLGEELIEKGRMRAHAHLEASQLELLVG